MPQALRVDAHIVWLVISRQFLQSDEDRSKALAQWIAEFRGVQEPLA